MKILLVEDDGRISSAIAEALEEQNYVVEVAGDGRTAWDLLEAFSYDLVLLDIMLPEVDGITLCQRLRSQSCPTPILMMTARDTVNDRVLGLDAGADDYLVKPFDLEELSARIRALRRRGNASQPPIIQWQNLRLDPGACEVFYGESLLKLSPTEYRLLELFLRHSRRVFSREQIIDHVWSSDEFPGEATVKAHIWGLRQKLQNAGAPPNFIETVYGLGYRLKQLV